MANSKSTESGVTFAAPGQGNLFELGLPMC